MEHFIPWASAETKIETSLSNSHAPDISEDVLIVEDNIDCGRVLARAIRYLGRTSECVTSGKAALESLSDHPPRVVILDVMMPDMDGVEVLRWIRKNPATARIPVVMYSAISEPSFRAYALSQGASDYWVKAGLALDELERRLSQLVGAPLAS